MTAEEAKEIQHVFGALAPMLTQSIEIGVLNALRHHHKETGADKLLAESRMHMAGVRLVEQSASNAEKTDEVYFGPLAGRPKLGELKEASVYKPVEGERNVWAQAYSGAYGLSLNAGMLSHHEYATQVADLAVEEFRRRYK